VLTFVLGCLFLSPDVCLAMRVNLHMLLFIFSMWYWDANLHDPYAVYKQKKFITNICWITEAHFYTYQLIRISKSCRQSNRACYIFNFPEKQLHILIFIQKCLFVSVVFLHAMFYVAMFVIPRWPFHSTNGPW
jgi:hypothetical protein